MTRLTCPEPLRPAPINAPALELAPAHLAWRAGPLAEGLPTHPALGGVVIQPAAVVLGLRGWEDAFEAPLPGVSPPALCACFDLEKLLRMALRQSGLAAETLASPACAAGLEAGAHTARRALAQAATRGLIHHYLDVTRQVVHDLSRGDATRWGVPAVLRCARECLTGARLAERGELVLGWSALREGAEDDTLDALITALLDGQPPRGELAEALGASLDTQRARMVPDRSPLPERVPDYDALQALLVRARLDPDAFAAP